MNESSAGARGNAQHHTGMSFSHATDRYYPFANNRIKDENFTLSHSSVRKGRFNAGRTHS
ncbi:hypothetical protein [Pseudomonas sp. GZD-222]|uniref:hypothetical protein n=1 Tax=Pseudomonas sp. GZD-222 TaxID=3404805 RepID=UPI003BB4DF81